VALLVAVMDTPGKTAPVTSETVPVSVALLTWPNAIDARRHNTSIPKTRFFILSPPAVGLGFPRVHSSIKAAFMCFVYVLGSANKYNHHPRAVSMFSGDRDLPPARAN
jgi:hypothetical protein